VRFGLAPVNLVAKVGDELEQLRVRQDLEPGEGRAGASLRFCFAR
jgi:hypothetical protein